MILHFILVNLHKSTEKQVIRNKSLFANYAITKLQAAFRICNNFVGKPARSPRIFDELSRLHGH